MILQKSSKGQALIEYILVVAMMIILSTQFTGRFSDLLRSSFGNLAHYISLNLTVGVCERDCYYESFYNGFK